MKNIPYSFRLIIFSVILATAAAITDYQFPGKFIHKAFWGILVFHVILTAILHYMTINSLDKGNNAFTVAVFGSIGLKLLLSIAFIIFYLFYDRSNSIWFAIDFIALYLFFTAFEIYSLLRNLRTLKK